MFFFVNKKSAKLGIAVALFGIGVIAGYAWGSRNSNQNDLDSSNRKYQILISEIPEAQSINRNENLIENLTWLYISSRFTSVNRTDLVLLEKKAGDSLLNEAQRRAQYHFNYKP